jgi:hypothetical protein
MVRGAGCSVAAQSASPGEGAGCGVPLAVGGTVSHEGVATAGAGEAGELRPDAGRRGRRFARCKA